MLTFLICFLAGAGAGLGTGFAGMSAAAVITPMLVTFLNIEPYTAVGTSVFIMTFTALTGSVSHFAIGGAPEALPLALCVVFTFIWARIAAGIANRASAKSLNRATGVILVVLGFLVLGFSFIK